MSDLARWLSAWQALGVADSPSLRALHAQLVDGYARPPRRYHTRRHLDEAFAGLDALLPLAARPAELQLALFFHDAIYEPLARDNEARSAQWAEDELKRFGAGADVAGRIGALVRATAHAAEPAEGDARVLLDADLAILATPAARFDEYERDVRAEYAAVPDAEFRRGRGQFIAGLLARPWLFNTPPMRRDAEATARANLQRSLRALAGGD